MRDGRIAFAHRAHRDGLVPRGDLLAELGVLAAHAPA
jgi:sulfonate transport system ATP-binding protein